MYLSTLHVHPLKGGRSIDLEYAVAGDRGLNGDRQFMMVDDQGRFITQREIGALARIMVQRQDNTLSLGFDRYDTITCALNDFGNRTPCVVWRSTVQVLVAPDRINRTLSQWLGQSVRLVYQDQKAERLTSARWTGEGVQVSLADGYPVLITNTASLDALNQSICERAQDTAAAVPMARFRPNLVIATDEPWAEDHWKHIRMGEVELELVKPCDRCVVVTHDQQTGTPMGNEPSASLMRLRRSAHPEVGGVLFGWNCVVRKGGTLNIGSPVEVLESQTEVWPLHAI